MKTGRYLCDHDWHGSDTINVVVDAEETEKSFILRLVQDGSRFPDGHMAVLFKDTGRAVISKSGSKHAIVNHDDWFVVYPNRNGVPFLFEYQEAKNE